MSRATFFREITKYQDAIPNDEIIAAIESGNDDEIRRVLRSFLPLLAAMARKLGPDNAMSLEDLIMEGYKGLEKTLVKYKPEKGASFATAAQWWIRNAICTYLSEHTRAVRIPRFKGLPQAHKFKFISLHAGGHVGGPHGSSKGNKQFQRLVLDTQPAPIKRLTDLEMPKILEDAMTLLSDIEREVIEITILEGKQPLRVAAERTGRGIERCRQIREAGLLKMKRYLQSEGYATSYDILQWSHTKATDLIQDRINEMETI